MKKFTGWGSGLPKSLAHVAEWTNDGRVFTANIKEFVDHMCTTTSDRRLLIEDEPALFKVDAMDAINDAFIAGVAETIAERYGLPCPAWTNEPCRFLPAPVYRGGEHTRQMYTDETPLCMSRRNLFCGAVRLLSIRGKESFLAIRKTWMDMKK